MTNLDVKILEALGRTRYTSLSYLDCNGALGSKSNVAKRLKKMFDRDWIGRQVAFEPIAQRIEFVYFLKKKGVEILLERSTKFPSEESIEVAKSHAAMTHDMAINWLGAFIRRDSAKYFPQLQENIVFESRRSAIYGIFHGSGIAPDAFLKIQLDPARNARKFLIEVDNSTENKKIIKEKLFAYRDYLQRHQECLLMVVTQHSEMRLAFFLHLAHRSIHQENAVFVCTLPEINIFGIFANIWTPPKSYHRLLDENTSERERYYLPL